jgi:ferredoxin-NADP reductase
MRPHEKNRITFIGTMTEMRKSSREWYGEVGFIVKAMLSKYISELTLPIFYIAGPQGMVVAMRKALNEAGVDDDNIRTEEFSGY